MRTFKHSGAIGDIIYSLPAVRALGGGIFYIGDSSKILQWSESLEYLLRLQPYIADVRFGDTEVDYNLDAFRNHLKPKTTVPDLHLDYLGLSRSERNSAWLTVDAPVSIPEFPVVINRTFRYLNNAFPWVGVKDKYGDKACFIGYEEEHAEFKNQFDWDIPHVQTANLLEAARLISGAKLFIGNQSSCYAVSEGLKKKPTVLEVWPFDPNCLFSRPGVYHGWDKSVTLPDV